MIELHEGDPVPELRLDVELWCMKVFSVLMADPNPIHFDPAVTAALGMGDRPVNQGTLTLSYPMHGLIALTGDPGRIRRLRCRFLGTVAAGDTVTAGGVVTAVQDGMATAEIWLDRGDGVRVLTGSAVLDLT